MYNSFSSSDDSSEDSISSPLLLGHSSMDSSSDEFEGHYDYPLPYFSESDSSSDDEDFHSHDDDEGPQILDDNNLSRVHISPLNDTDQCIHYDLPHKEAKSLFFPAETNNYLINVLKTELKPILQRAHKEVHELELNTRKFVQTQSQACRSAVADPEFLASSHLFYFIEEATNRFFTDAAKKLDNLCKENEMQQKLHFERWMSKVNYFFSRTKEDFMKSNKVERLMRSQVVPKAVFQDVQHCLICTDKKPEVAFQYNADDLENMVPCTCTNVNMCLECALSTYWASTRETGMSFAKCPFCKGHFKVENVIKVKPVLPPQPVIINNTNNTNNSNNNGPEKVEAKTEKEAPEGRRYPKRQRKK